MNGAPYAKKSLGQHWLVDVATLEAIVALAKLTKQDTVLEIGPGGGSLTKVLAHEAGHVTAVELDAALVSLLKNTFKGSKTNNLEIIHGDILKFDLTSLPPDYKVVANIPYYLTSHLLRVLSDTSNQPIRIVLLVQKEVARRVAAVPGSMSLLGVTAQFYWDVNLGPIVPAGMFAPPPKVDSQVLVLRRRQGPLFAVDTNHFFRVVKAGFANRRKTLLNSLNAGLRLDKEQVLQLLTQADIAPSTRPQELSMQEWRRVYQAYQSFF